MYKEPSNNLTWELRNEESWRKRLAHIGHGFRIGVEFYEFESQIKPPRLISITYASVFSRNAVMLSIFQDMQQFVLDKTC